MEATFASKDAIHVGSSNLHWSGSNIGGLYSESVCDYSTDAIIDAKNKSTVVEYNHNRLNVILSCRFLANCMNQSYCIIERRDTLRLKVEADLVYINQNC